jgi:hypothetical protein
MKALIDLSSYDNQGRLKQKLYRPSHSFLQAFIWNLSVLWGATAGASVIPLSGSFGTTLVSANNTYPAAYRLCSAPGAQDNAIFYTGSGYMQTMMPHSIQIGTGGSVAPTMLDPFLGQRITHGTGAEKVAGSVMESYTTGDDAIWSIYGVNWGYESFQCQETSYEYTTDGAWLYGYRTGNCGNLTVSIRDTEAGVDRVSGTILQADIPEVPGWIHVTWTTPKLIAWETLNTYYYLVVRALTGDVGNKFNWRYDTSSSLYLFGYTGASSNSGASWGTLGANTDFLFSITGTSPAQMEVGGVIVQPPVFGASDADFSFYRIFYNGSADDIIVNEMGLYLFLSSHYPVLYLRDCFPGSPITVAPTEWLKAQYTFRTSI